jgi:hypothetical protein
MITIAEPKPTAREMLDGDDRIDFGFLINDLSKSIRKAFDRKMKTLA